MDNVYCLITRQSSNGGQTLSKGKNVLSMKRHVKTADRRCSSIASVFPEKGMKDEGFWSHCSHTLGTRTLLLVSLTLDLDSIYFTLTFPADAGQNSVQGFSLLTPLGPATKSTVIDTRITSSVLYFIRHRLGYLFHQRIFSVKPGKQIKELDTSTRKT